MVVDDDESQREILAAFLKSKNYHADFFSDAESALRHANSGAEVDVVISDLNLPGLSGMDLLNQIKEVWPNTPLIMMTGTTTSEIAVKAIENGAYDFAVKPLHLLQLMVSIDRAVHFAHLGKKIDTLKEIAKAKDRQPYRGIIGKSPRFLATMDVAKRVAKSHANIFIVGESGTGKEVVAKFVHAESKRKNGPFVPINCSAIPENLLESELFGHAKGAFSGAIDRKIGLFEEAENGTLFLDEIGDLSLPLQAKILRVIQERQITRVGENRPRDVNVRIVSATHKNLTAEIEEGRFREDLFFRLNVIPVHLAPLRERQEDILPLAEFFLEKYSILNESPARRFSKEAIQYLLTRVWPGNVRELQNAIERAVVLCDREMITIEDLKVLDTPVIAKPEATAQAGDFVVPHNGSLQTLQEVGQKYIEFALAKNSGAKDKTARDLGIDRKTLYRRISNYDVAHSGNAEMSAEGH